ncbi:MAG: Clp protease ClpP [Acidobacteriota bacterium]|nr:Clp protease ClpP [Acidobacteriota bacterium]
MSEPRKWFNVVNQAEKPEEADVLIYGYIGKSWWDDDAVSAKKLLDILSALPATVKSLNVKLHSEGGSVFEGIAIANGLRDQRMTKGRTVNVIVEGLAASIASVIAMAGNTIRMGDNALMFVHDPWGCVCGNAKALRQSADDFDKFRDQIVTTYQWHSTLSTEDIQALMAAETWLNADEAIAKGFATEKIEGLKAAACLDSRVMATLTVPDQYRDQVKAFLAPEQPKAAEPPQAAAASDVLQLCADAGLGIDVAQALITEKAPLAQVTTRVNEAKAVRAAAAARETSVRALCANAKCERVADQLVKTNMTIDEVKAHLTTLVAMKAEANIDPTLDPDTGTKATARIDAAAIYAQHNKATVSQ